MRAATPAGGRGRTAAPRQKRCATPLGRGGGGHGRACRVGTATDPKLPAEIHTGSGGGGGIQGVARIHPGHGFALCGKPGEHRKGQGGASRTIGPHQLRDSPDGHTPLQQGVDFRDACWGELAKLAWPRGKSAGDAPGK